MNDRCEGSGRYPAEQVMLDTTPGMDPSGTCQVCGRSMTLNFIRLPEHDHAGAGAAGDEP